MTYRLIQLARGSYDVELHGELKAVFRELLKTEVLNRRLSPLSSMSFERFADVAGRAADCQQARWRVSGR